tara:strand:+ start:244 stop:921 length:678 start_codon:yes stop_codon:yes gene_type:complete
MPLTKKSDAGDYVDDFSKSKAPQFKGKSKKKKRQMAIAAYLSNKNELAQIIREAINEADPKKGTGKKPKGSSRRLYTDEDPSDTVKVKFSTRQDIVDTLAKKTFKSKSHARQSQVINLIHQRTRAAYGRTKDPKKKKRLKSALDYITSRKEASKRKTQRMKKEDLNAENFRDGKKKGKSRPGRVKKAGASCKGSVTSLRAKAKKYGGEKGKMYHWCANMKAGKKK